MDIASFLERRRQKALQKPEEIRSPPEVITAKCALHCSYDSSIWCNLSSISIQRLASASEVFIPRAKPKLDGASHAKSGLKPASGAFLETFGRQEDALTLLDELLVEEALSRGRTMGSVQEATQCCDAGSLFPPYKLWSVEVRGALEPPALKRSRPSGPEGSGGACSTTAAPAVVASRRFVVASIDSFFRYLTTCAPAHRHGYEIIRADTPCHLYFDVEYRRGRHAMKVAHSSHASQHSFASQKMTMQATAAGVGAGAGGPALFAVAAAPLLAAPPESMDLNVGVDGDALVGILLHRVAAALHRDFGVRLRAEDVVMLCSSTDKKFSRHLHVRPRMRVRMPAAASPAAAAAAAPSSSPSSDGDAGSRMVPLLWASAEHAGLWVQRLMRSLEGERANEGCDPLLADLWTQTNEWRAEAVPATRAVGDNDDVGSGAADDPGGDSSFGADACTVPAEPASTTPRQSLAAGADSSLAATATSAAAVQPQRCQWPLQWVISRSPIVDTGVYTRNRAMRLPFSSKLGKGVPLLPAAGNRWGIKTESATPATSPSVPSAGSAAAAASVLVSSSTCMASNGDMHSLQFWWGAVRPVRDPPASLSAVAGATSGAAGAGAGAALEGRGHVPALVQSGPADWERALWRACLITAAVPPLPLIQQVQRQIDGLKASAVASSSSNSSSNSSSSPVISAASGSKVVAQLDEAASSPAASATAPAIDDAGAASSASTAAEAAPQLLACVTMMHAIDAAVISMPFPSARTATTAASAAASSGIEPAASITAGATASGSAGFSSSSGSHASPSAGSSQASWRMSSTISARVQAPPFPALQKFIRCAAAGPAASTHERWAAACSGMETASSSGAAATAPGGLGSAADATVPLNRVSIRAWAAAYEIVRLPASHSSPGSAGDGSGRCHHHGAAPPAAAAGEPAAMAASGKESGREVDVVRRLYLDVQGSRWCNNIGRQHESNGVRWVVDLAEGKAWQTCWDRGTCAGYRSPALLCPDEVLPDQLQIA